MIRKLLERTFRSLFAYKNQELPAFLLHKLFHQGTYLPQTNASLKLRSMACIVNDISINSRRSMLEFGSGISTIIMARLLKNGDLKGKIVSVDHDSNWIEYLTTLLSNEGLDGYVTFVHAPLVNDPALQLSRCYEDAKVLQGIQGMKFDLVLIDGPNASSSTNVNSRVSNSRFIFPVMQDRFSIYIDDTNRSGEQQLTRILAEHYKVKALHIEPSLSILVKGSHYSAVI